MFNQSFAVELPDTAIIVVWRKFTLLISWPVAPDTVIIMVWRRLHKTNTFKPGAALRKVIPEMIFLSAAPCRKMHYRHNLESVCKALCMMMSVQQVMRIPV